MSALGLVNKDTLTFDSTNYDVWKIRMLNLFREIHPIIGGYLYVGFSSPMDTQNESLEEKLNSHINALATKILLHVVSNVVLSSIMPYSSAREIWTKLQDKYSKSNIIEDDCVASTSGRDEFSSSTTSPTCDFSQGNEIVSGDRNCNMDSVFTTCNPSYLSSCNDLSLDFNTSSTTNSLHACVNSPFISCRNDLNKSHDDMPVLSCF